MEAKDNSEDESSDSTEMSEAERALRLSKRKKMPCCNGLNTELFKCTGRNPCWILILFPRSAMRLYKETFF
jgi:hypothetical protein